MSPPTTGGARPDIREKIFEAGSVEINYAEGPRNGRPLVLLHGLARNWQDFLPLIPKLSQSWHVYAVDMRGHGKSARVPRGYASRAYAVDVVELLGQVVGEPAVLFGHSMGAVAVMHVAAEQPQLVQACILGDNVLFRDTLAHSMYPALFAALHQLVLEGGSVREMAARLAKVGIQVPGLDYPVAIGDLPGNDEAYLLKWADCLQQVDPQALEMTLDGSTLADFDGEDLLRRMKCPTLLLQASPELGGLMPNAEVEKAMRLLARPKLVRFPLLGHALHLQQAQPVLQAVCAFLDSL